MEPVAHTAEDEVPAIVEPEGARGFWANAFPLLVLGIISLMLMRACVPGAISTASSTTQVPSGQSAAPVAMPPPPIAAKPAP